MQRAREVAIKYNLSIDHSSEKLDLDWLEDRAQKSIISIEGQIKYGILNNNISVATQKRFDDEIKQNQKMLESVLQAKKELSELT